MDKRVVIDKIVLDAVIESCIQKSFFIGETERLIEESLKHILTSDALPPSLQGNLSELKKNNIRKKMKQLGGESITPNPRLRLLSKRFLSRIFKDYCVTGEVRYCIEHLTILKVKK